MGEVGGAKGRSITSGSADDQMYCHLCTNVKANAWCLVCNIYLCPTCEGHHKKIPTTKDHGLLSGPRMPSFYLPRSGSNTEDIQKCPDHPLEEIKSYCPTHDSIGCVACHTLKHATCAKQYIPDISAKFKSSKDYKNLTAEFQATDKHASKHLQEIDSCLKEVDKLSISEINKLQQFKALIIAYLDQREKELLTEIKNRRDQDTAALVKLQTETKALHSDLDKAHKNLKSHEENSNHLFITAKRAQTMLNQLQTSLDDIKRKTQVRPYTLEKDPLVETLLRNKDGVGKIVSRAGTSTAISPRKTTVETRSRLQRQNDIQVGTGKCRIYNLAVVSQDTLLLCNESNDKMELVSRQTGKVLSQLGLEVWPWRVCLVGRDRAAVTLGRTQKVQLIKIKGNTLVKDKELKVSDNVYGITTSGDNLVVTYYQQPWLEAISTDGKVLHQFHSTGKTQHFKSPDFITTSADGTLWVSDQGNNTITKMDARLTILQTFTSPLLQTPRGITAVTEDEILVCSQGNNSLVLLQPSTNTMSTLLGKEDEIERPYSLTYCPQERKVFVSPLESDSIQVFKFT